MRRHPLVLVLVIMLVLAPTQARAAEDEVTATLWPAHASAIVGGLALATTIAFGSLQMNAEHSARVAESALASAGARPGSCNADVVRPELGGMCGLLARHEAASEVNRDAFTASLAIGLTSLAFAVAWYVIAK